MHASIDFGSHKLATTPHSKPGDSSFLVTKVLGLSSLHQTTLLKSEQHKGSSTLTGLGRAATPWPAHNLEDISSDDEWIAAEESPNEPNKEWPSVFHRDAQEEDENGDKDKEVHNLSDCELENEVRDFDDLPMDLDERNDIYDEGLPLEDNIHQINDDFGF
uniref:Uncharacterized protein n=1 Tax=Fagus sylvatica TaxID=28930 RepID=A0A2N9HE15_FAGSY